MLIEGVDDSVLLFVCVVASLFLFIVWHLKNLNQRHVQQQLHPDSIIDVTLTRELLARLQHEQENATANVNVTTPTTTATTRQARFARSNSLECPICLSASEHPIETNCGHLFCGNCIIQLWHAKTRNLLYTSIQCPICRQSVTMILPLFSLETQENTNEYRTMIRNVNNYNRKFSGAPRSFMEYVYDVPTLLRHAINELFSLNGIHFWYRIRVTLILIMAFFYLISPFDLIPEAVFGIFGVFDDICILFLVAIYISVFYRQFITNRNAANANAD